jgi:hypothetical protein
LYLTPDSPKGLLEVLDVAKIREALGVQNGIAPSHLLKQYFEMRAGERSARLQAKILSRDTTAIIAYADSILKRKFTFVGQSHRLSHKIDWRRNPTNDKVWLFTLNRQEWLWDIAAAYLLTNNSKYALAFEEILHGWFEQNPRMDWKDEADPVWRLIESSLRMSSTWIDAFTVFFPCDEIDEALKWRMLGSFYEHAQFLAHFRSPGKNHLIQESYGLLAVAGAFPEFKASAKWLELANLRLEETLSSEIYPDGGYVEGSTFYHRFVVRILQQIADFADEFEVELSGVFHERLERMYAFLMQIARPDGVMPQMNDGFRAKSLRTLYREPARMFGRQDFEFFASQGERGREPEMRSVGFPYSGVYVMRSDWSPEARYMIVDAGLFGSSHGHEDKLSFELFAYGKPFIVEGGNYTYKYDRWHRYFESSFAHNTIVVDQRSQLRMANEGIWAFERVEELPNVWYSNELFDYVEASYDDGYGNNKESMLRGLKHTRRILFVKPDYWIIWDVVSGDGEYPTNQLFHFTPEAEVRVENDRDVIAIYDEGPRLTLRSLSPEGTALTKATGSESPIQGWVSPEYGVKAPAAAVDFESKGPLPRTFVTVLFPSANKDAPPFEAELVTVFKVKGPIELSEAVGIRVEFSHSTDYILMAPGNKGELRFENHKSDHQLYLRKEKKDGPTVELGVPH